MENLESIITENLTQTRRNAIAYARENNYKVDEMYSKARKSFFDLMDSIHANNKDGNYELARQYSLVYETLETWAK